MTRSVTLAGYTMIAVCALGLEFVARRWGRVATFAEALSVALARWPLRLALQVAWLWLGWHVFARADWQ